MTAELGTARQRLGVGQFQRPRSRRRRILLLFLLLAVVALVVAAGWLALSLLGAARDARAAAGDARSQLGRAATALRAGDDATARQAVKAARGDLDLAEAAAGRTPVRIAAHLPLLSSPVSDLDHLLAAGRILVDTADRVVAVEGRVRGDALFHGGRIDLNLAAATTRDAKLLLGGVERARSELDQVRAGPLSPGAGAARDATVRQLDQVEGQVRPVVALLDALPGAVGANGGRTYLVAVMNSAESKAWGGSPLAVALLRFDHGAVSVLQRGQVGEQRLSFGIRIPFLPSDPWHKPREPSSFTLAGLSPDFPTSGEEVLRAYQVLTHIRPDGVIAIDPVAMAGVLKVSGSVTTPGYGRITYRNLVQALLVDSYQRFPGKGVRHGYNEGLMDAVLSRLLGGGGDMLRQVRGLGEAAKGRHLQLYFRDPSLQRQVLAHRLGGALSPAPQDYAAAYTQNINASKVDVYQRRAIEQRVWLRPDGSAHVVRSVRLVNAAPGAPTQDRRGYFTNWAEYRVIAYVPGRATKLVVTADGKAAHWDPLREAGRQVVRFILPLQAGQARTVTMTYDLPGAAVRTATGLRYRLAADSQPMVQPASLRLVLAPPKGFAATLPPGWKAGGGAVATTVQLTSDADLGLELQRRS
ncbi:MAG TPA: DUF4012 domain-containing protein [Actinomycetes bacterium]